MKKEKKKEPEAPQVLWHEENRTLTLEGEPVLDYALSWPELADAGRGGRRISRYYARLAQSWRLRWQRELYWRACLALSQHRAASRPFQPWHACLRGEVTAQEEDLLSLRLEGEEVCGGSRACRACFGDVWRLCDGAPCSLKEVLGGQRRWKRPLLSQLTELGDSRRAAGDCFLDPDWAQKARRLLPEENFCLLPGGLELFFPQCTIAPAAEGVVCFRMPRPGAAECS